MGVPEDARADIVGLMEPMGKIDRSCFLEDLTVVEFPDERPVGRGDFLKR